MFDHFVELALKGIIFENVEINRIETCCLSLCFRQCGGINKYPKKKKKKKKQVLNEEDYFTHYEQIVSVVHHTVALCENQGSRIDYRGVYRLLSNSYDRSF